MAISVEEGSASWPDICRKIEELPLGHGIHVDFACAGTYLDVQHDPDGRVRARLEDGHWFWAPTLKVLAQVVRAAAAERASA